MENKDVAKKLYFISTNGYDCLVSDNGRIRRGYDLQAKDYDFLEEVDEYGNRTGNRDMNKVKAFLESVEDDSSWEQYSETLEELFPHLDETYVPEHPVIVMEIEMNEAMQEQDAEDDDMEM